MSIRWKLETGYSSEMFGGVWGRLTRICKSLFKRSRIGVLFSLLLRPLNSTIQRLKLPSVRVGNVAPNTSLRINATYRRSATLITVFLSVLIAGVGGYALFTSLRGDKSGAIGELSAYVNRLLQAEAYEQAAEKVAELLTLAPSNTEYLYQQALIQDMLGNRTQTLAIMNELLKTRQPKAALWLLDHDFGNRDYQSWDAQTRQRFETLTELAGDTTVSEDRILAMNLRSTYQLSLGNWEDALGTFEQLAAVHPAANLNAASLAMRQGETQRARMYATRAEQYFEPKLHLQAQDDTTRIHLARALILLQRESEALKLLSDGFELTHQPRLQQAAGEAMVMWSKRLAIETDATESLLPRLQLVHRASQCAPSDQAVMATLLSLIREFQQPTPLSKIPRTELLRSSIAKGIDRESAHFMLGSLLLLEHDLEPARLYLNLAAQAGTHIPTVFNNLALEILRQPNNQVDDALLLIDAAIEQLPGQAHFCETRGRILMRLERWEEAIPELKRGLEVENLRPWIYSHLVTAYRKLGNEAAASELEAAQIP